MKRRHFGVALVAGAAAASKAAAQDQPPNRFPTEEVNELRLRDSAAPNIEVTLDLAVKPLHKADLDIRPGNNDDEVPRYFWKEQELPADDFWPGCTIITRFELHWGKRKISVPERFWNDLPRMKLNRILKPESELRPDQERRLYDQIREGWSPWLQISNHRGTVMVHWPRPEE